MSQPKPAENKPKPAAASPPPKPRSRKKATPAPSPKQALRDAVVAAFAAEATTPVASDVNLLEAPANLEQLEAKLRERHRRDALIATGHFVINGASECRFHPSLSREKCCVIRIVPRSKKLAADLAYVGCRHARQLPRLFLGDDVTLKLSHQLGGVIIVAPSVAEVFEWRRLGVPALPIAGLAAARPSRIKRFWRHLARLPLEPSPRERQLSKAYAGLLKQRAKPETPKRSIAIKLSWSLSQLRRDIVLCATTCSPAMTEDRRSVDLLRQLEQFAPDGPSHVALWDPSEHARQKILYAKERDRKELAPRAIRQSLETDLRNLPKHGSHDEDPGAPLAEAGLISGSSAQSFQTAVERDIISPLLQGDWSASPLRGALRIAETEILRQITQLSPISQASLNPLTVHRDPSVNNLVQLSNALLKLATLDMKLDDDRRR